eukprot:COSAG01_NODE_8322_length_2830_cov_3.827928_5_plen_85_part_00
MYLLTYPLGRVARPMRGRRRAGGGKAGGAAGRWALKLSLLVPPMKLRCRVSILLLAAAATQQPPPATALDNGLGVTPPMGWRSW